MGGSEPSIQTRVHESFGAFLRGERLARNVALDAVQDRTKIKRQLFADLERNDLTHWPADRFYRESYLRAYARAVGLDSQRVVERFRREFPIRDESLTATQPRQPNRQIWLAVPLLVAVAFFIGAAISYLRSPMPVPDLQADDSTGADSIANVRSPEMPAMELLPALAPETEPAPEPESVPTNSHENVDGELTITSTPAGHVTVNGIGRGETPVQVRFLPAGSYTIRIVRAGYPIHEERIAITKERPSATVSVALEAPEDVGALR